MSSPGAIAFQIGPFVIRWYGILMATAIVVGLWLAHRQARKEGLPADDIISVGAVGDPRPGSWARVSTRSSSTGITTASTRPRSSRSGRAGSRSTAGSSWGRSSARGSRAAGSCRSCAASTSRRRASVDRAGDRPVGELLQRGGVRRADRSSRGSSTSRRRTGRRASRSSTTSIPRSSTSRCGTSRCSSCSCSWLRPRLRDRPGALFFCLHRALLDRSLRHRGDPARQLLDRLVPRAAAREPRRRRGRDRRARLDAPAGGDPRPADAAMTRRPRSEFSPLRDSSSL